MRPLLTLAAALAAIAPAAADEAAGRIIGPGSDIMVREQHGITIIAPMRDLVPLAGQQRAPVARDADGTAVPAAPQQAAAPQDEAQARQPVAGGPRRLGPDYRNPLGPYGVD